jgi:intein/homing endonuclease
VPRDPQPVARLRVQGGYELVAGPAQPVSALDLHGDVVWRPAVDLRPGDVLVLQPGRGLPPDLPSVPLPPCPSPYGHTHKTLITPAVADEELACFFGYAVGNGTLSVASRLSWTVNLRDQAFAAAFNADAERRFGVPVRPARPYRGAQSFHLFSVPLRRWLAALGLAKDRVPDFVWRSRSPVVAAFLRGYFSADGCATDDPTGRVSIASSRPQIIAETQALLLALGIPACRRTQRHVGPGRRHTVHTLNIVATGFSAFAAQAGFALPRRQARLEALLGRWSG